MKCATFDFTSACEASPPPYQSLSLKNVIPTPKAPLPQTLPPQRSPNSPSEDVPISKVLGWNLTLEGFLVSVWVRVEYPQQIGENIENFITS
eukprot:2877621-Amphidinium_carterae.1